MMSHANYMMAIISVKQLLLETKSNSARPENLAKVQIALITCNNS